MCRVSNWNLHWLRFYRRSNFRFSYLFFAWALHVCSANALWLSLNTMSQDPETQLDTDAIMHELSVDSEVTFRKVMGSAEILPTRPGIHPYGDTQPMDKDWSGSASTPPGRSSLQLTPTTSVSASVIAHAWHPGRFPQPTPRPPKLYTGTPNSAILVSFCFSKFVSIVQ